MATYLFCDNKCKHEGYTKEEVDIKLENKSDSNHTHDDRYYTEEEINNKLSIQKETITWTDVDGNGSITATFRRYGNCVNIEIDALVKNGVNMISVSGGSASKRIIPPDWAKPDTSNVNKIYGKTQLIQEMIVVDGALYDNVAEFNVMVLATGDVYLVGYANVNINDSTDEHTFHLTSNYILD